jgi:dynein heavy chain
VYNPHLRPEIAAQSTIVNFIVTESGLEEQLLAIAVNIKKNELDAMKQELVKKQKDFTMTLHILQNTLLDSLNSADKSTILANTVLIENLDKTLKKMTHLIQTQSAQSQADRG